MNLIYFGESTAGNIVVRAWQQAGASNSNKGIGRIRRPDKDAIPGWRLFYLDDITSILPTGKFFDTSPEKIRPKYNPNDQQMSKIFLAVEPNSENSLEVNGTDSLGQADSIEREIGGFDVQADKLKIPISKKVETTDSIKKNIFDLYELVTKQKKKAPSNYYVVNKDGNYYAVTETGKKKFKNDEIIGNLKELFNKYSNDAKPSKSFFNTQRDIFKRR